MSKKANDYSVTEQVDDNQINKIVETAEQTAAVNVDKKKIYNVNDKNGDVESTSLNSKLSKNVNNVDNIELVELQSRNQPKTKTATANKRYSDKNSNKLFNFLYKTENILDLNLKFKNPLLEKHYKQAYLQVTRLLFTQYLFYLIIFTLTWIIYFAVSNSVSSTTGSSLLTSSNLTSTPAAAAAATLTTAADSLLLDDDKSTASSFVLVVLLIIFLIFLLVVFVFVLLTEIKETRYRVLEKKLREQEMETKVNFDMAEKDVKLAMQEVVKKEKEYDSTKIELKSRYASVKKLRGIYSKIAYPISIFTIVFMFFCCFASFAFEPKNLNQVGHFVWFCESLLLIYAIYPFEMLISIVLGTIFSIFYEILAVGKQETIINLADSDASLTSSSQLIIFAFIKFMLHLSVHLIGIFIKLSAQATKRNTFLKVGHMHKAHMNAQQNKDITERMIKSIMPPLFTHVFGKPEEFKQSVDCEHQMRPLYIYPVSELSILFADIVGFTKMSSTKTAEELVFLLNDLYGRFDRLCEIAGCEKISTLGDCYYCVSGCLNGRQDHAKCCVEMGLLMVKEIEAFNKTHKVDVNMRVGVHTGKALCGFIGGKRFRFDVWSSDVTLANKMESTGKAGWVHISEDTFKQLQNKYNTEPGEKYSGKSTYFVLREIKKETVADALKQSANKDLLNASSNTVTLQQMSNESKRTNLDVADISDSGSQKLLNNSILDNTASILESNRTHPNESILTNMAAADALDEQSQLLLAVKEANFYRPDINYFTMRFSKSVENKYKAFVIGLNNNVPIINSRDRNAQMSFSSTDGNNIKPTENQHQQQPQQQYQTPQQQLEAIESKARGSNQVWTYPRNTIFFSILVSFLINFLVSTAYLLSFIVSSMSYKDFKISSVYNIHFSVIFGLFAVFFVVQFTFLLFYLLQCTTFISKSTSKRTFLFDVPNILNRKNKNEIYQSQSSQQQQHDLMQRNPSQHTFKMNLKIVKAVESHVATRFYTLNLLASFLMSLVPTYIFVTSISATNCINRKTVESNQTLNLFTLYSYFCFIVSLIHFCSFVQLSSLIKTTIAFVLALAYGLLGFIGFMVSCEANRAMKLPTLLNATTEIIGDAATTATTTSLNNLKCRYYTFLFVNDFMDRNLIVLIDFALLIFLIWLINRQSEIIQRLSFKCDQDANQKVTYAKEQKELANWLIEVVLPSYVVDHVKDKRQYSKNYDSVGVLFVSLCNFGEFFEETYEGGRELLRILNEITVDFDRLFDDPKYKNIEKIKSIGSTFMIASGLNQNQSASTTANEKKSMADQLIHLYDLIDFAIDLNQKLEAFNNEAMSVCHFKFKMRMGFNAGPVTAGVIGTERLLYDIWGDTVNVASRMDSTGEPGQLQLPESVANMLNDTYTFKYRGHVQVKGKDNMITYFMNPKENKPKMGSS